MLDLPAVVSRAREEDQQKDGKQATGTRAPAELSWPSRSSRRQQDAKQVQ